MSVPDVRGWVERPDEITLEGLDENGVMRMQTYTGPISRLVQHEEAHLHGSLFPELSNGVVVPKKSFENQDAWVKDWPTPGSHLTKPGQLSEVV